MWWSQCVYGFKCLSTSHEVRRTPHICVRWTWQPFSAVLKPQPNNSDTVQPQRSCCCAGVELIVIMWRPHSSFLCLPPHVPVFAPPPPIIVASLSLIASSSFAVVLRHVSPSILVAALAAAAAAEEVTMAISAAALESRMKRWSRWYGCGGGTTDEWRW